jgi:hypothetical protein
MPSGSLSWFGSFMILEMGCKLEILSLKFQLKLHNLLTFMVPPSPRPSPFSNESHMGMIQRHLVRWLKVSSRMCDDVGDHV